MGMLTFREEEKMTSIFEENGASAWARYHNCLKDILGGEQTGVVIQPLAIAERAEWDTGNYYYDAYLQQKIANNMPTWTPLYTVNSGVNVPDEYQAFLDELNTTLVSNAGVPDPAKLKRLDDERANLQKKYQSFEKNLEKAWKEYIKEVPEENRMSRADWEVSRQYAGERTTLERQLQAAIGAYALEANKAGGDLMEAGRAIAMMGDRRQRLPLPASLKEAGQNTENWQTFYRANIGGDLEAFKKEIVKTEFSIEVASQETTNFEKSWNAQANTSWFLFFKANGSVEFQDKSQNMKTSTTSIKISFNNITSMPIERGQWFKGGLVSRFRDRLSPSFWGQAGRLNLIPTEIIVGHGLSIEVSTTDEMKEWVYSRESFSGGGGLSIGPFRFGGKAGYTTAKEHTKIEKTNSGLTITDTSGRAVVLAVVSIRPADLLGINPTPLFDLLSEDEMLKMRKLIDDVFLAHASAKAELL